MSAIAQWAPPAKAPSHLNLRRAAATNGFEELAVRELLWLINAHGRLVAHGRVFQNLASLLSHIAAGRVGRLGNWSTNLSEWIRFCAWATDSADILSALPGMQQFNVPPKSISKHPQIGEGVDRHPVVAAMWNRHQSVSSYPPEPDNLVGWRYFNLQAHLLYSYIDARWRLGSLAEYEDYDGPKEHPIAPAVSSSVSRAMREFSHARYDGFLSNLNSDLLDTAFYAHLSDFVGGADELSVPEKKRADDYLLHLKHYFNAAWRAHRGDKPRSRKRQGGGGGVGSKIRVPGYISFEDSEIFLKNASQDEMGDDSSLESTNLYFGMPTQEHNDFDELSAEKSGLCASEDLEPILELVEASKYAEKIHRIQYAHLAREMAAQRYNWDWSQLTSHELQVLWSSGQHHIAAASANPSNKAVARYNRISSLLLKIMLMFGQSFDRAHSLRIVWIPSGKTLTPTDLSEVDELVLFVEGDAKAPALTDRVLGFGLPGLSPIYKAKLDEDLKDVSRQLAEGLLLPDLSNLGDQLLAFHRSELIQDRKVFHIDKPKALAGLKALLHSFDQRITLSRITRALPALMTQQTGDETLSWVAFSMKTREVEPRLHYTMYSTARIREAYSRAAAALLKEVGHTPSVYTPEATTNYQSYIGCRFVLSFETLQELIGTLKERLTSRYAQVAVPTEYATTMPSEPTRLHHYRDFYSPSEFMPYDRDYLFYTYLMLTTSTGTRAINQPVSLYLQWLAANEPKLGLVSGLWDKETMFFDKSRLVTVLPSLAAQFKNYRLHIEFLMRKLGQVMDWKTSTLPDQLLITFDQKSRPGHLTPTWIEEQFKVHLGVSVPGNFSRAFLRTELLERGVHAELVDAHLGHASEGESPFSKLSTFDFGRSSIVLQDAIAQLQRELGMVPVESRLVPHPTRLDLR